MAGHAAVQAPIVKVSINGGTVIGKRQPASMAYPKPVDMFYAIPYATAGRFQRAKSCVPIEASSSLDAQSEGKCVPCPMAAFETEEGVLHLNVFRAASDSSIGEEASTGRKLPVMIYIHGGAFNFGNPLERNLASFVSWSRKDILVVAVGYRLGALGFEGDAGGEMNLGLRDQRIGVEWVRRWIGGFGGDAEDVTMMGVSAGAHSVGHHILHPARVPFTKAILESGSATARCVLSPHHPRVKLQHESLKNHTASQLLSAPLDNLLDAWAGVWEEHMDAVTWPFQPVIDGDLIPRQPFLSWDSFPSEPKMSVITGYCTNEGTQFVPSGASTNGDFISFFKTLIPGLADSDLERLQELYPDPVSTISSPFKNRDCERNRGTQFRRLYTAYGHYAYMCPILHTAQKLSSRGHKVYVYEYAATSSPHHASSHGDQVHVVAHDVDALEGKTGLMNIAREMNTRWTSFIASPGGNMDGLWPRYGEDRRILVFGEGNDEMDGGRDSGVAVREGLVGVEMGICEFWWERMGMT